MVKPGYIAAATRGREDTMVSGGKRMRILWTDGDGSGDSNKAFITRSKTTVRGHPTWKMYMGKVPHPIIYGRREPQGMYTSTTTPVTQSTNPEHTPLGSSAHFGRMILTIWATSRPTDPTAIGLHISKLLLRCLPGVYFMTTKQPNMSSVVARLHQNKTPPIGV